MLCTMDVAADRSSPRNRTREEVFRLIETNTSMTRAQLIEVTGFSRSTVNHAVSQLISAGRVIEEDPGTKGPGSGSGRPAGTLRIVPHGVPAGALDFGHAHIKAAVIDPEGEIIAQRQADLDVDLQAERALDLGTRMLDELGREAALGPLGAVVAGIPGPLDATSGLVRSPTILSSWVGLDPREELRRRLDTAVHVENDAVLGAFESCGAVRARASGTSSTSRRPTASERVWCCAASLPRLPRLRRGDRAHPLPGHTDLCRCGNRGCLEAVVSVASIGGQFAHTHPQAAPGTLRFDRGGDPITQRILDDAGRLLGEVLAVLCNLLNPAALIIGGELGSCDGPLLDGVKATVHRNAQPAIAASLRVLPAQLGVDAELVGAATMAAALARR
ncbi:ROK family protein [Streptacidiphilus monticola]